MVEQKRKHGTIGVGSTWLVFRCLEVFLFWQHRHLLTQNITCFIPIDFKAVISIQTDCKIYMITNGKLNFHAFYMNIHRCTSNRNNTQENFSIIYNKTTKINKTIKWHSHLFGITTDYQIILKHVKLPKTKIWQL